MFEKRAKQALAVLALFAVDQALKNFFGETRELFCNAQGPFGISIDRHILFGAGVVALVFLAFLLGKSRDVLESVALVFILAGGLGNVGDRLVFGCVRDFQFSSWLPFFNVSDVFLGMGALLLLFGMFRDRKAGTAAER